MRLVSIKMPEQLADEMRRMSNLESLKRGRSVTLSGLLRGWAHAQCGCAFFVAMHFSLLRRPAGAKRKHLPQTPLPPGTSILTGPGRLLRGCYLTPSPGWLKMNSRRATVPVRTPGRPS
jgi:hypothetical protein